MNFCLKGGTPVDPANQRHRRPEGLIEDGLISTGGPDLDPGGAAIFAAGGLPIPPGLGPMPRATREAWHGCTTRGDGRRRTRCR